MTEAHGNEQYKYGISVTHPCGRDTTLIYTDSIDHLVCGLLKLIAHAVLGNDMGYGLT